MPNMNPAALAAFAQFAGLLRKTGSEKAAWAMIRLDAERRKKASRPSPAAPKRAARTDDSRGWGKILQLAAERSRTRRA